MCKKGCSTILVFRSHEKHVPCSDSLACEMQLSYIVQVVLYSSLTRLSVLLQVYVWSSSSRKSHYIGAFPTPLEAARAYDVAVLWLMGQDVRPRTRLNFSIQDYNLAEIQAEAAAVAAMRQLSKGPAEPQRRGGLTPPIPLPSVPAAAAAAAGGGGSVQHSTSRAGGEGGRAEGPAALAGHGVDAGKLVTEAGH